MRRDCPELSLLEQYDSGALPPAEIDSLRLHLRNCQACKKTLVSIENTTDPFVNLVRSSANAEDNLDETVEKALSKVLSDYDTHDLTTTPATKQQPVHSQAIPDVSGHEVIKQIGAGGMGTVFLARHMRMDQHRAVKVLPENMAGNQRAILRFQKEVLAGGKLSGHPNIVQVYDARQEHGRDMLIMEYP